jgi:hypothetical protein
MTHQADPMLVWPATFSTRFACLLGVLTCLQFPLPLMDLMQGAISNSVESRQRDAQKE